MNELKIFAHNQFGEVRTLLNEGEPWFVAADVDQLPAAGSTPWHGYVYAIEYGDGIKIGHTTNLRARIKSIKRTAANYSDLRTGRVAFSKEHTNHKDVESQLHSFCAALRVDKCERFNLSLDEFLASVPAINFKDESAAKQERSAAFGDALRSFATGGRK